MKRFFIPSALCVCVLLVSACASAPDRKDAIRSPNTVWDETLGEYHIHVESPEGFPQLTGVRRIKGNGYTAAITRGGVEVEKVAGDCMSADTELDFSRLARGELEIVEYCGGGERQKPFSRTRIHLRGDQSESKTALILRGVPYDAEQCRVLTEEAVTCAAEHRREVATREPPDAPVNYAKLERFWECVHALRDMAPGNPSAIQAAIKEVREASSSSCEICEVFSEPYETDQIAEWVAAGQVETFADCIASSASWQRVLRRHAELGRTDCRPEWIEERDEADALVVAVGEEVTDSPDSAHFHRYATLKIDATHRVWRQETDAQGNERWVADE